MLALPQPLQDAVEEIRREKLRGASWALLRAVRGVVEASEAGLLDCGLVEEAAAAVESANRTMAPLANLAYVLRESCRRGLPGAPAEYARRLLDYQRRTLDLIRSAASGVDLERPAVFSYSSTVEALLAGAQQRLGTVVVFESRPGGEGAILAANLRSAGMQARLLPDTMMPAGVDSSKVVLVGADAVTRDACLYNKVGTLQLAMIADTLGKPLVAVFDATKIHPSAGCGGVPVEERVYMAAGYGPVRYPVFDMVPGSLVKAAITEKGPVPFNPDALEQLWASMIDYVLGDER